MKILTLIILIFTFNNLCLAKKKAEQKPNKKTEVKHDHSDHKGKHDHSDAAATSKKIGKDKVLIEVQGMVCAFCAQGIEKNFGKRKEVKSTKVDLDKMEVLVQFKKGKSLDEKIIKELVTDAGFSYKGIKK